MNKEQIEAALKWATQGVEHYKQLLQDDKVCPDGSETAKMIRERLTHNQCAVFALSLALRFMGEPSEGMISVPLDRETDKEESVYHGVWRAMRDRLIEEVRDDR